MVYSRSGHDRRVIVPKLVQRKTKPSIEASESVDGKENRLGLPKRGGRGRQKIPDVDQKFITEKTTYTCDKCSKTFSREAALRRHVKYDHENSDNEDEEDKVPETVKKEPPDLTERPYTCSICRNSFKEIACLKSHMLTHSDVRDYVCTFDGCSDAFKTKGSLVRHMRRHTGERPFCCVMCNRRFTESGALTRHLKARTPCTAKSDSDLPCYGKRWDFASNVSTTETPANSVSNGLMSNVATDSQLTDTVNEYVQEPSQTSPTHSIDDATDDTNSIPTTNATIPKSPSHSNEENSKFRTAENFEAFKQTQCRVCEEDFSCLDSLRVHLRTHLADTPLRCDFCHFMTEERKEFSRHILSQHKNELKGVKEALASRATVLDNDCYSGGDANKTLLCQNAEIAVNQLLMLRDKNDDGLLEGEMPPDEGGASDVQSGRPVYKCHVCPRTFRGSAYLKFHLRNHTGDRPFRCAVCNKTFTVKNGLDKHLDTHSEERNYKCGECGKLFKRIAHVREHIKIHSSLRPYPCVVCEKSFKTSNALKVHMRIHSDIMPYECRFCQRHFREKASLQRHIRLHTGERPFQCEYCKRRFTEHGTLNRHLKAKVPCVRHLNYSKQTNREPDPSTTVTSTSPIPATPTDTVIATATTTATSYPTVLAEFSSVVADTQQYIVSESGQTENDLETAEYVVLHTSEDIVQKVEIITDASMVEQTLLETANSNETASYVVVHANSPGDNLHMLGEHTMQRIIMPADTEIVHTEEDIEESIVEETGEALEVRVAEEVEHSLQTVTLVGQTLTDENMTPSEETVSMTTADTIQQAMLAANMVDTCTNQVEEQIELQTVGEDDTMEVTES